ncbi:hypothetical protein HDU98_007196 [Podochytrium sp. JEL0797]|nr:hypothetical protein HDU98_007196 [Podochytrium sp. JEL0797]
MNLITAIALLAATASAQFRCGSSWDAANTSCGVSCTGPEFVCPISGDICYADLDQALCGATAPGAVVTATGDANQGANQGAGSTAPSAAPSAAPPAASATGNDAALAGAVSLINQIPSCAVPCIANGASAVTAETAQALCVSFFSGQFNMDQVNTCITAACGDQANAATSWLVSNSPQLASSCQALVPSVATASGANASGTMATATVSGALATANASGAMATGTASVASKNTLSGASATASASPTGASSSNNSISGLSQSDKSLIYIVSAWVILGLLILLCTCLCCGRRKPKTHAAPPPPGSYV